MESDMRQSGIDVVGKVPWGTHFCQFYETDQDLIETLVPYFRDGLAANEFCMWITSAPLQVDQAREALRSAVPDLDKYIENGQIEILDYSRWYIRSGKFSAEEVLQGWVDKLSAALERGYEGLRLSGNTFWLEQADWDSFTWYEEAVNNVIGQYHMLAICTYCLQKCSALEILDVVANHQFALTKRSGRWEIIEGAHHKKMEQALRKSEERYCKIFKTMTEGFSHNEIICDDEGKPCDLRYLDVNPAFERQTGLKAEDVLGHTTLELFPRAEPIWFEQYGKVALTGESAHFESWFGPLGRCFDVSAFQTGPGRLGVMFFDITERKRGEEALAREKANLQAIFDAINVGMLLIDENGVVKLINNTVSKRLGEKKVSTKCGGQPGDVLGCIHAVNDPLGCGHTSHCASCPVRNAFETALRCGRSVNNVETEIVLSIDGNEIRLWLSASADPLILDGKKHAILALNDITELKRIEGILQKKQAELESQNDVLRSNYEEIAAISRSLLESEQKYATTLASIGDAVISTDVAGKILFMNAVAEELTGWTLQEASMIHVKEVFKIINEYTREKVEDPVTKVIELGAIVGLANHTVLVRRDGTEIAIDDSGAPIRDRNGNIMGVVLIFRDITERKRSEEALHESEEKYRELVENANSIIIKMDRDGIITFFNDYAQKFFGYFPEEIIGTDVRILVPPIECDSGRNLEKMIDDLLSDPDEFVENINENVRKNGEHVWISWRNKAIMDSNRNIIGNLAIGQDITERRRAEEALSETRDYLESLIEYANAPIIVWDPSFRITRFNHAFERLTGLRAVEALSEPLSILFPEGSRDVSLDHIRRTMAGERWEAVDIPILKSDGSIRTVLWNSANIYARNGTAIIATIAQGQDITDRKLAEEELRKARDELELRVQERTAELSLAKEAAEAAALAKSDFMANMSHEIRTPMNAVIGMTSLLLDDETLNPEQRDFIETIRMSGDALMVIINDILDFSKMQENKVILEDQPFDLASCVEEALDLVASKASEKSLNLAYTFDKSVPGVIIGDPNRLRQILSNLLINGVKFTERGEVKLHISAQELDATHEIHFAIQDTGIGISPDQMDHLFQPFSQVDYTVTRNYGGVGLGLVISKRLIELMDGRIWVESELGKGSTFHFTIKAETAPCDPLENPVGDQPQLVGRNVLIVNDNRTNRRILGAYIYSWGMVPLLASTSQDALDWIRRGDAFDVAILDMNMQDMDGLTLAREIRRYNKILPLVMLASIGQHLPADHAHLMKPIKPSQLHRVLTNVISTQLGKKAERAKAIGKEVQKSSLRILLAEDNVTSQKVAIQMLKRMGYKADVVANGIEALQALERQPYDLVLMDLRMPEMDGLEATRIIRQRWGDNGPKIVAVTAYALQGDREKCIEAGMDDYISKPIKVSELTVVLREYQT